MPKARPQAAGDAGLTLLELLVVITILVVLTVAIGTVALNYLGGAKADAARLQLSQIEAGLDLYRLDMGRYPTEREGLGALIDAPRGEERWNGPYLRKSSALVDPWGNAFSYDAPTSGVDYTITSMGADGASGGKAMRRTSPTGDRTAGLTLLELLVTLSVLMLILAAMAGFGRGGPPDFDTTVRELVSQLRQARAEAIRTGQVARFVLDTEARRYGQPDHLRVLHADIDLTVETLQDVRTQAGDPAILFFPDGSSSGAIIAVSDASHSQTISVRWLTGLVRLDG